jgi:hypothetical protein
MILKTLTLGQVLAPLVSGLLVIILYHYLGKEYLGADENKYWNALRVTLLSAGDSTVRKKTGFALTNPATDSDELGTVKLSSPEFAQLLENAGYLQGVLSGLKYRPTNIDPNTSNQVSFEDGSMVYRESKSSLVPDALAVRQVHVYWFDNGDGSVDIYAHEEYSSLNPLVAWKHYMAETQNAELGKERLQTILQNNDVQLEPDL